MLAISHKSIFYDGSESVLQKIHKTFIFSTGLLLGSIAGCALVKKLWLEKYRKQKVELAATSHERELLHILLKLKQKDVRFGEYFTEHRLQSVAVLGMGREGRYLLDELAKEREITTAYGVEADYLGSVHETLIVYRLGEDKLPPADCLVVCDLVRTGEKTALAEKEFFGKIVTLEEVLDWLMDRHGIKKWRGQSTSSRPVK